MLVGALSTLIGLAAPPAPKPPDREALALVEQLLSQRPAKELSLTGVFKIRQSDGRRADVPVSYFVRLGDDSWESIYATQPTKALGLEKLVVVHRADQPNRYLFTQITLEGLRTNSMTLTGA